MLTQGLFALSSPGYLKREQLKIYNFTASNTESRLSDLLTRPEALKCIILCHLEDVGHCRGRGGDVPEADALGPHLGLDVLVLPAVARPVPLQHRPQLLPLLRHLEQLAKDLPLADHALRRSWVTIQQ